MKQLAAWQHDGRCVHVRSLIGSRQIHPPREAMQAQPLFRSRRDPCREIVRHHEYDQHFRNHEVHGSEVVVVLPLEWKMHAIGSREVLLGAFQLDVETRRTNRAIATRQSHGDIDALSVHITAKQLRPRHSRDCVNVSEAELRFLLVQVHRMSIPNLATGDIGSPARLPLVRESRGDSPSHGHVEAP